MSPLPPYLKRAQNPDKGVLGRKAEKSLASRLGARQVPGSGAGRTAQKGDMKVGDFLIENKSTVRDSFSISSQVLAKIYNEASMLGKTPAMAFQFLDGAGGSQKRDRWVCIPEAYFQELVSKAEKT